MGDPIPEIEHEPNETCVCGPTAVPVKEAGTGAVGWIYLHHSLDGREAREKAGQP